jgi:photosystem II stability/assembly factor-like uncharacterized protein
VTEIKLGAATIEYNIEKRHISKDHDGEVQVTSSMVLLLGTLDGLYRVPSIDFDRIERVLDGGSGAYTFPWAESLFAKAGGDLYRSSDDGVSWSHVETPPGRVTSVQVSPDGDSLYVGMYPPARLYVSHDSGSSWHEFESFPEFQPIERYLPEHDGVDVIREDGGTIHDLRMHPDLPDRIIAGIEPQGVVVSDDSGEMWSHRRYGLHGDVHDIETVGANEYVVASGQGLYHTGNAGRSWTRLDTSQTYFEYTYFHGVLIHDGMLFTAAATGSPGNWSGEYGANAVLFESDDFGESFEHVVYPGGPEEIVLGFAEVGGRVVAGTMAQDWDKKGTSEARVIERTDEGTWQTAGSVPAGVITIAAV